MLYPLSYEGREVEGYRSAGPTTGRSCDPLVAIRQTVRRMADPIAEVTPGAEGVRWFFLWRTLLRFVVPAVLLFVLWDAVPGTLSAVAGLFG